MNSEKKSRPRYRTRQFGARVSFPITSDLRKSLEEESGKEKRSMASLAREAIADFIPRLRDRRRKRSPEGDRMSGHAAVSAYGRLTGDPRAIETRTGNPMNWPNPWPGM